MFSYSKAEIWAEYMLHLAHRNTHLIMAEYGMSKMLPVKSPESALQKDRCCQGLLLQQAMLRP